MEIGIESNCFYCNRDFFCKKVLLVPESLPIGSGNQLRVSPLTFLSLFRTWILTRNDLQEM